MEADGVLENTILTDICTKTNKKIDYIKVRDSQTAVKIQTNDISSWSVLQYLSSLIQDVFLPKGYPDSVSSDYLEYQIWDTCQAFCSSISGTLTMGAIMQGIGVGSESATPLSAAITWLIKDGTGMVGSILFAWLQGSKLDSDCKKWRFFADILNDVAMFVELSIPFMISYSTSMLCIATLFKALVGTAGSSTRAALITHQAIKGNIADVSAKDGSQEIFTNLLAFIFGIFVLKNITQTEQIWTVMCTATLFHLLFNYKAVKCLKMNVFNSERFCLSLRTYLPTSNVPTIEQINRRESVILLTGMKDSVVCGFSIKFGGCIKKAIAGQKLCAFYLSTLTTLFQDKNYFLLPDIKKYKLYVTFREKFKEVDVLKAYFHASLLAIALTYLQGKKTLHVISRSRKNSPVYRLRNILQESISSSIENKIEIDDDTMALQAFMTCEDFMSKEFKAFYKACEEQGWNLNKHLINIDDWRADWVLTESKRDNMKSGVHFSGSSGKLPSGKPRLNQHHHSNQNNQSNPSRVQQVKQSNKSFLIIS